MTRVPELASAVLTGEPALVVMDEHVVVETVLAGEGRVTYKAHKWLDSCKRQNYINVFMELFFPSRN